MTEIPQILVAVSGASGAVYAKRLLERLLEREQRVGLVITEQGWAVLQAEGVMLPDDDRIVMYPNDSFDGPFATGSQSWKAMVVAPCSMGMVGRIAAGISNDLVTRAADVALKEHRRLILVPRETPLSVIHLRNLTALAEAGAVIVPPVPGFYQRPQTMDDLIDFMVERILAQLMQ